MFIVDDPLLALIARFIGSDADLGTSEEEFLKRQVATLTQYVERFPEELQQARAMEWIERHAEQYRREWQRMALSRQSSSRRCSDCPLIAQGGGHCEIHGRWRLLLEYYLAGDITSKNYIANALELLRAHKSRLRRHAAVMDRRESRALDSGHR